MPQPPPGDLPPGMMPLPGKIFAAEQITIPELGDTLEPEGEEIDDLDGIPAMGMDMEMEMGMGMDMPGKMAAAEDIEIPQLGDTLEPDEDTSTNVDVPVTQPNVVGQVLMAPPVSGGVLHRAPGPLLPPGMVPLTSKVEVPQLGGNGNLEIPKATISTQPSNTEIPPPGVMTQSGKIVMPVTVPIRNPEIRQPPNHVIHQHHHHHHHHHHQHQQQHSIGMHVCAICLAVKNSKVGHMEQMHPEDGAWLREWNKIPRMTYNGDDDVGQWIEFISDSNRNRMTAAEAKVKQQGLTTLSRLLPGDMLLIPFGSTVMGTTEKGSSDIDITIKAIGWSSQLTMKRSGYAIVIGKQGATRRELESLHNTRIVVPPQGDHSPIRIFGDSEQDVLNTIQAIKDHRTIQSLSLAADMKHTIPVQDLADEVELLRRTCSRLQAVLSNANLELLTKTMVPILRLQERSNTKKGIYLIYRTPEFRQKGAEILKRQFDSITKEEGDKIYFDSEDDCLDALTFLEENTDADLSTRPKMGVPPSLMADWDITARPQFGPRNSVLLRMVLDSVGEPALVACCLIKKWGKIHGVSDARNGFLSSYALTILLCYFLQHAGYADFIDPQKVQPCWKQEFELSTPSETLTSEEYLLTREIVLGFYDFYSKYDWENRAVVMSASPDIVHPKTLGFSEEIHRKTLLTGMKKDHIHSNMLILDPYDGLNAARRITKFKFIFIKGIFHLTSLVLRSNNMTRILTHPVKLRDSIPPVLLANCSLLPGDDGSGPGLDDMWVTVPMSVPSAPVSGMDRLNGQMGYNRFAGGPGQHQNHQHHHHHHHHQHQHQHQHQQVPVNFFRPGVVQQQHQHRHHHHHHHHHQPQHRQHSYQPQLQQQHHQVEQQHQLRHHHQHHQQQHQQHHHHQWHAAPHVQKRPQHHHFHHQQHHHHHHHHQQQHQQHHHHQQMQQHPALRIPQNQSQGMPPPPGGIPRHHSDPFPNNFSLASSSSSLNSRQVASLEPAFARYSSSPSIGTEQVVQKQEAPPILFPVTYTNTDTVQSVTTRTGLPERQGSGGFLFERKESAESILGRLNSSQAQTPLADDDFDTKSLEDLLTDLATD